MGGLTLDRIQDLYSVGQLLMLSAARPLGFALVFTAFSWGHLNAGLLRIGFAIVLALPVMSPFWLNARDVVLTLPVPFLVLLVKELFLGILIGFLASVPFEALSAAGGIVDNYRGTGTPIPGGAGEITPFAQVFVVTCLWLFAALGGFWLVTDLLYASLGPWPLLDPIPPLTTEGAGAFITFLTRLLRFALVIAGPLVVLMLAVDIIFGVAGKIGKQLNVTFLAMSVKGLIALLALPFSAMVIVRVVSGEVQALTLIDKMLQAVIR